MRKMSALKSFKLFRAALLPEWYKPLCFTKKACVVPSVVVSSNLLNCTMKCVPQLLIADK